MLISILAIALIATLVFWLIREVSIPEPFRTVLMVILVIVFVVALLNFLPGGNPLR